MHEEDGQPQAEPDFAPAEELITATGADIRHGGERAFYPSTATTSNCPPGNASAPPGPITRRPSTSYRTGANLASNSTESTSATPCAS